MPCCITRARTPEGEDSPRWSETVASRMESDAALAQPVFDDPASPSSDVETPFKGHDASSGLTPHGERSFAWRINQYHFSYNNLTNQPGLKGWREESPIKLFKD